MKRNIGGMLAAVIRPEVRLGGSPWSMFHICGGAGLALAFSLGMSLTLYRGLSPLVFGLVTGAAVLAFFGLVCATKILTGAERLVYYHHEIGVSAVVALFLSLLEQPVLPYLSITILGVGAFLACGRIGCLMVGCCHGRPSRWGIRYRDEHAAVGFPSYLVGVRLFPVQALESAAVLGIVAAGSYAVVSGMRPELALEWYVFAYGVTRFLLEFARGDADRPYRLGFSEAQWTSLLLVAAAAGAEVVYALPPSLWAAAAPAFLIATMVVVSAARRLRSTPTHQLLHPRHVQEVAQAIARLSRPCDGRPTTLDPPTASIVVAMEHTSLGILLSASSLADPGARVRHFALSRSHEALTPGAAEALAKLILRLRNHSGSSRLIAGAHGVFHLLAPTR